VPFAFRAATSPSQSPSTPKVYPLFLGPDKSLASARHFPSINWLDSYSEYLDDVPDGGARRSSRLARKCATRPWKLLSEEDRLSQIVKLVGPDALRTNNAWSWRRATSAGGLLKQNAMDPVDSLFHCPEADSHAWPDTALPRPGPKDRETRGPIAVIHQLPAVDTLIRMKNLVPNDQLAKLDEIRNSLTTKWEIWRPSTNERGQLLTEVRKSMSRPMRGPSSSSREPRTLAYDEVVEIRDSLGRLRRGRVLEVAKGAAMSGICRLNGAFHRWNQCPFLGETLKIPVADEMLGRDLRCLGVPLDGGPQPLADRYADVNGQPSIDSQSLSVRVHPAPGYRPSMHEHALRGQNCRSFPGRNATRSIAAQIPSGQATLGTTAGEEVSDSEQFAIVFAAWREA